MNERIRELLPPKLKEWGADTGDNFSEELEKFAQLIVRECIEIFNDDSDNLVFQIHNKISRDKIKQHFGVEE